MTAKELIVAHDGQLRDTGRVRLIKFGDDKAWIPESQMLWEDEEANELLLPTWVVIEKGLEGYQMTPLAC